MKIYYYSDKVPHMEPRLLCQIDHPNVLRVLDARVFSKEWAYFVTPQATGGDLNELFRTTYNLQYALDRIIDIIKGISVLHSPTDRLIHRDLKPDNILIHEEKAVIADFGSVKVMSQNHNNVSASQQSILYKPPEAFDNGEISMTSDIYQIGLIAYQLLGGKLHYDLTKYLTRRLLKKYKAETDYFIKSKIIDERIQFLSKRGRITDWSTIPDFVPKDLIRCVKKACHIEVNKRLGSCSQFLRNLSNITYPIPKWIINDDNWFLKNWNEYDYKFNNSDEQIEILRARTGTNKWRKQKRLYSAKPKEVLQKMVEIYNLNW